MTDRQLGLMLLGIIGVLLVALTLMYASHDAGRFLAVHLSQETGTSNSSSRAYDFWSGFGSDIGEAAVASSIVAGIAHTARSRNCEVKGCWRLGLHTTEGGHKVCRRHHPDDHLTEEAVHRAHHEAKARRAA